MVVSDQLLKYLIAILSTLRYKNRKLLLLCNTQYHRKQNNLFRTLPGKAYKIQYRCASSGKKQL